MIFNQYKYHISADLNSECTRIVEVVSLDIIFIREEINLTDRDYKRFLTFKLTKVKTFIFK